MFIYVEARSIRTAGAQGRIFGPARVAGFAGQDRAVEHRYRRQRLLGVGANLVDRSGHRDLRVQRGFRPGTRRVHSLQRRFREVPRTLLLFVLGSIAEGVVPPRGEEGLRICWERTALVTTPMSFVETL